MLKEVMNVATGREVTIMEAEEDQHDTIKGVVVEGNDQTLATTSYSGQSSTKRIGTEVIFKQVNLRNNSTKI